MNLKPVFEGSSRVFLDRMGALVPCVEDVENRINELKLERSYASIHKIRFVESLERGACRTSYYDACKDEVSIYPMAFTAGTRIDLALYSGFGDRFWATRLTSQQKTEWMRMLVSPDRAVMDRLEALFKQGDLESFDDVLEKFNVATERLQVIHVLNALIKNNVSVTNVRNISVFDYPATKDFCKSQRSFSLVPLVSVYGGLDNLRDFGPAFAHYCSHYGKFSMSDHSTADSLTELFKNVCGLK